LPASSVEAVSVEAVSGAVVSGAVVDDVPSPPSGAVEPVLVSSGESGELVPMAVLVPAVGLVSESEHAAPSNPAAIAPVASSRRAA
jgi:hypothetical protein